MTDSFAPGPETARAFRQALGSFATGVTLVTATDAQGEPVGFIANSFSSLSLDPPLVLWSPAISSRRYPVFAAAQVFAVHVLGQAQSGWPARFARGGEGFRGLDWQMTPEGVPALPGALARFDCRQHATYPGGDHVIIVGLVQRVTVADGAPLVFAQGRFGGVTG
jgi:flavin reductase (DIM6/NTAB) family NADH-FMN oxidoreductase RutF